MTENCARIGGRDLHHCLVGFDFDYGLIGLHVLTFGNKPPDDLCLGQALADIGKSEFVCH